jgi:protein arginine N-methyltransferase 1
LTAQCRLGDGTLVASALATCRPGMRDMTTTYSVTQYGSMIACRPRMEAFAAALERAVAPGCTVLDIGAGTGVFSLLACKFGAGRVIAIEPSDAVHVLRASARHNGFADRIEIFQGLSTDFAETACADVIISDLRGSLPLFEHHLPAIIDARQRLLATGGTLIPLRDTIRIALACHPDYRALCDDPWAGNPYGIDLSAGRIHATHRQIKTVLKPADLLCPPADLMVLDYRTVDGPNQQGSATLEVSRDGMLNGFSLWFDAEIATGLGYSNAPGQPTLVYESAFFPLESPVPVAAGDVVEIDMSARLVGNEYVWIHESAVRRSGQGEAELLGRIATNADRALAAIRVKQGLKAPT